MPIKGVNGQPRSKCRKCGQVTSSGNMGKHQRGKKCAQRMLEQVRAMERPLSKRCTAETPCPPEQRDVGKGWTHPFETTYEGTYFDTRACPHCGFEVKVQPER